ncbi:alpha/beta fold hydrolase [Vibrio sp. RC27]
MTRKTVSTSRYTQETGYEQAMSSSISDFWQQRESGYHSSFDGSLLHWCKFSAAHHTKAIFIVNGRIETVFKYQELFYDLFQLGYDIYSYDHRGQGLSKYPHIEDSIGHVEQFQDYVSDLESMVEFFELDHYEKKFLLAHSMGGAITLRYLQQTPQPVFSACVAVAPMVGLPVPWYMRPFAIQYTRWLSQKSSVPTFAPGYGPYETKPFLNNPLSQSKQRYKWFRQLYKQFPELQVGGPSITWVWQSLVTVKQLLNDAKKLKTPLLILQAGNDQIVENQAQVKLMDKVQTVNQDAHLMAIKGANHELLFEKDEYRNRCLKELTRFIERYTISS